MNGCSCRAYTHGMTAVTLSDLYDTTRFLSKVYPGKADEERLVQLIDKYNKEIERRKKK